MKCYCDTIYYGLIRRILDQQVARLSIEGLPSKFSNLSRKASNITRLKCDTGVPVSIKSSYHVNLFSIHCFSAALMISLVSWHRHSARWLLSIFTSQQQPVQTLCLVRFPIFLHRGCATNDRQITRF